MRERSLTYIRRIDDGVSLYDRDRVEGVAFKPTYKYLVDKAVKIHDDGRPSPDIFNRHPANETSRRKEPLQFMLPKGVNPHEPMKHLAKACIDVTQGYGLGSVVSIDMAKASRFDSARDTAIKKLRGYHQMGALGFVFAVMRYEDSPTPVIESLRASMIDDGAVLEQSEAKNEDEGQEEDSRLPNVARLLSVVREFDVPTMALITMEPYESAPVFEDDPVGTTGPEVGPGTSSLG